jgi:hypothetical protein
MVRSRIAIALVSLSVAAPVFAKDLCIYVTGETAPIFVLQDFKIPKPVTARSLREC